MAENAIGGSLLEAALSQGKPKRGECGVARVLHDHPRSAEISELLAATPSRVTYVVATKTLKDIGVDISAHTISRHARGMCSCRF